MKKSCFLFAVVLSLVVGQTASAQGVGDIRVEITNEGNSDFFLTPLWFGFHNGNFDMFDVGSAASADLGDDSVERLAEDGMVDGLQAAFTFPNFDGVAFGNDVAPPPINPGETGVGYVSPSNPGNYPYFSFASMVIPSNDAFIGNDDPLAYRVFNNAGDVIGGTFEIQIFGREIWDAGTEVNDEMGAAFSALGGTSSDENGVVTLLGANELDDFAGSMTAAGTTINNLINADELLATIRVSIVPEPTSMALAGMALVGLCGVRRRR